jgi:hypothetical protein
MSVPCVCRAHPRTGRLVSLALVDVPNRERHHPRALALFPREQCQRPAARRLGQIRREGFWKHSRSSGGTDEERGALGDPKAVGIPPGRGRPIGSQPLDCSCLCLQRPHVWHLGPDSLKIQAPETLLCRISGGHVLRRVVVWAMRSAAGVCLPACRRWKLADNPLKIRRVGR